MYGLETVLRIAYTCQQFGYVLQSQLDTESCEIVQPIDDQLFVEVTHVQPHP